MTDNCQTISEVLTCVGDELYAGWITTVTHYPYLRERFYLFDPEMEARMANLVDNILRREPTRGQHFRPPFSRGDGERKLNLKTQVQLTWFPMDHIHGAITPPIFRPIEREASFEAPPVPDTIETEKIYLNFALPTHDGTWRCKVLVYWSQYNNIMYIKYPFDIEKPPPWGERSNLP